MKIVNAKSMALALAGVLGLAGAAGASEAANSGGSAALVHMDGVQSEGPQNWGTTSDSSVTYVAHAFAPIDSGVTYNFALLGNNLAVHRTNTTNPWMEAPINLPNGAQIRAVEFRFCDTSTTAAFASFLTINSKTVAIAQPTLVTSTAAENIGCVNRTFTFTTPLVVDNNDKAYSLEVNLGANNNTIAIGHARVFYRLQVSPAPATASFTDVPVGSPLHRFVEALAASGVTGGCGGGNYCPNDPITRGQMAVFLASALGMHFPN